MKVKFLPQNISVEIKSGESVLDVARAHKLPVSSSCNGMSTCAECRVYIVKGNANILPPSVREEDLIGGGHFIDNRRLSCQLVCFGDITVDLSEQIEKSKAGSINKQFLKKIDKDNIEDSSSLGGIFIEDQDINSINIEESKPINKNNKIRNQQKPTRKTYNKSYRKKSRY